GLRCLPALNGATCALGNFPHCLTARSALASTGTAPPRPGAFVLLALPLANSRPAGLLLSSGRLRLARRVPVPRVPMSSTNGTRKQRRHEPEQRARAAARRISRQIAHDREHRPPSPITLPRITCLEDCDTAADGANAARPR